MQKRKPQCVNSRIYCHWQKHTWKFKSVQHTWMNAFVLCLCAILSVDKSMNICVCVLLMFPLDSWENKCLCSPVYLIPQIYTMTEGLWGQYRESDVMQLQTLIGIRRNITHCHKKHTQPLFPTLILPDRLLRESSSGREWKDGKETIQVRRKLKGIQNKSVLLKLHTWELGK